MLRVLPAGSADLAVEAIVVLADGGGAAAVDGVRVDRAVHRAAAEAAKASADALDAADTIKRWKGSPASCRADLFLASRVCLRSGSK